MHKHLDLLLAFIITLLNITLAILHIHLLPINLLLALPLIFLLPGYTLLEVLFYKYALNGVQRVTLSLGLSITIAILCGFLLNMRPQGLTGKTWTLSLGSLTITCILIAACLRGNTTANGAWLLQMRPHLRKHIPGTLLLLAAAVILLFTVLYSDDSAKYQRRQAFTELWLLQKDPVRKSCSVYVGIDNFEFKPITYSIVMTVNGTPTSTWPSITLPPQKTWHTSTPITSKESGALVIEAKLYRADSPYMVYRNVHLTLHTQKQNPGQEEQCKQ